jgi:TM2 domain-containing membrane protein YozV
LKNFAFADQQHYIVPRGTSPQTSRRPELFLDRRQFKGAPPMSQYQPPGYQPPTYQPPQQQQPYYAPQPPVVQPVVQYVNYYQSPPRSPGVAALLEVLPGFFFQTFGIGHNYAGNVGAGLLFMFGFWFIQFINFLLCFVLIGFVTFPLCWLAAMVASPIIAANTVSKRLYR